MSENINSLETKRVVGDNGLLSSEINEFGELVMIDLTLEWYTVEKYAPSGTLVTIATNNMIVKTKLFNSETLSIRARVPFSACEWDFDNYEYYILPIPGYGEGLSSASVRLHLPKVASNTVYRAVLNKEVYTGNETGDISYVLLIHVLSNSTDFYINFNELPKIRLWKVRRNNNVGEIIS